MSTGQDNNNSSSAQYGNHHIHTMERNRLKMWNMPTEPHESERNAVAILRRNGIYAVPGKWSEWRYSDVVAFGCVVIETKFSTMKHGGNSDSEFSWRVSPVHHGDGLRGQIVMLMCDYGSHVDTALFPATHDIFYKPDGSLKKGMAYRPNKPVPKDEEKWRNRYGLSLNRAIWNQHRNNWQLVFDQLEQNVKDLTNAL